MEQVSPTRMNLLIKKRQIKIAAQGANLLKNKRDALLQEFMDLIKPLLQERRSLEETLRRAAGFLALSLGVDGPEAVESAAMASKRIFPLQVSEKRVWGVRLPEIQSGDGVRSVLQRGYSPFTVSSRVDLTADAFEKVLHQIVKMAPMEIKLKRIGAEIKKTTRRVNALEQKVIPELKSQVAFIRQVLEDREREDKFRLKRLRAKKERKQRR